MHSRSQAFKRNNKQRFDKEHQNGYQTEFKRWKFSRASEPDELWQIDFRGHLVLEVRSTGLWFASMTTAGSLFALSSLTMI
jgi:hypothetical protein